MTVIPAKAGIQYRIFILNNDRGVASVPNRWTPLIVFIGEDTFITGKSAGMFFDN